MHYKWLATCRDEGKKVQQLDGLRPLEDCAITRAATFSPSSYCSQFPLGWFQATGLLWTSEVCGASQSSQTKAKDLDGISACWDRMQGV